MAGLPWNRHSNSCSNSSSSHSGGEEGINVEQQSAVRGTDLAKALSVWRLGGLRLDLPLPIPDSACSGLTGLHPLAASGSITSLIAHIQADWDAKSTGTLADASSRCGLFGGTAKGKVPWSGLLDRHPGKTRNNSNSPSSCSRIPCTPATCSLDQCAQSDSLVFTLLWLHLTACHRARRNILPCISSADTA